MQLIFILGSGQRWQQYTQGALRPDPKFIVFSDNASALLPFSSQRILRGLFKQSISSPAGTFGGWLSLDGLLEDHGRLLLKYIMTQNKNLTWRLNPFNSLEAGLNIENKHSDETHALSLECGFETIYERWSKGNASAARKARKARKAGIHVREAATLQDWRLYYEIYEDSLKRWGKSASSQYDWCLFTEMHGLSSINIKLWLATFEDKLIAGALCFYAKKHVAYWHGSALAEFFNLRPVNLLMFEVVKKSCEHGYHWFDFNPSGGHEGVRAFKKSFGADELACPVVDRNNLITKLSYRLKSYAKNKIP